MVQALFSHYSKAHSSCSAPVRQAQMLQACCCHIFQQPLCFSFPFFFSLSHPLSFLGTFQAPPLLHLLSIFNPSPPNPAPSLKAGGHSTITHHLLITRTMGALVALAAATQCARPLRRRSGGKSPALTESVQSSIVPTFSVDENSCQCGLRKYVVCRQRD